MGDQTDQTDPTKQYEQLEHTDKQQPHPGVTQAMQDQPDHGEDSYRGSRRLTGKRTVITGAGNVQWQQAAIRMGCGLHGQAHGNAAVTCSPIA